MSEAIQRVLEDPAVSYWLKDAINALLKRDPVDASRDADTLAKLMRARCVAALGSARGGAR